MHGLDVQKKAFNEDLLETIEEARKDEVTGLRRCVEAHKMSGNNGTIQEILSWVKITRTFNRRVTKSVNKNIRNMMNSRVN